jgi:small subunit ribosomal protein S14
MKSLSTVDKKNRNLFNKFELNFKNLQLIKKNNIFSNFQKSIYFTENKYILNNYKVKLKNRCILTGRSSSIYRIYRISRIKFRDLGRKGFITGLKKSSW